MERRVAIATWSSRGGQWVAELIKGQHGYDLRELKHGAVCGNAYRPYHMIADDNAAIAWAEEHVRGAFDVKMKRTQP